MNVLRDSSLGSSTHRTRLIPGSGEAGGEPHEGMCVCGGKKKKRGYWSGYRDDSDEEEEGERGFEGKGALMKALKGDGMGRFSETEVRRVVRALGREERMRL